MCGGEESVGEGATDTKNRNNSSQPVARREAAEKTRARGLVEYSRFMIDGDGSRSYVFYDGSQFNDRYRRVRRCGTP